MNKQKNKIFITLEKFLQGKKWEELTKKERLEISKNILDQMFPK